MLFHSFGYVLVFLPAVVAVYWVLRATTTRSYAQAWLLAASIFFYASGRSANVPLLVASIAFNWAVARRMTAQTDMRWRRGWLIGGLTVDIIVLFLFKYVQLFLDGVAWLHGPQLTFSDWGFPLGVSFFTLTQIIYLIDAYPKAPSSPAALRIFRGIATPNSLFDHATFVAFFPHLTAGPLSRVRSVVPQFHKYQMPEPPIHLICRGLFLFSMGLAKKVVFGDYFGHIADVGFAAKADYSMVEAWIWCVSALLHVYFDFSGYSDMAVASAWMLGIDIPQNFHAPLRSRSIAEFWQRWHISLSSFITDYLYTPLLRAFGRPTLATSAVATVLAMIIAAIWHGPKWIFIGWGLSHGVALAAHQAWKRRKLEMPDWLGWALTIVFLVTTFAFLQSSTPADAAHMISRLLPHGNVTGHEALVGLVPFSPTIALHPFGIGLLLAVLFGSSMDYAKAFRPSAATVAATSVLLIVSIVHMNSAAARQFVYFAF